MIQTLQAGHRYNTIIQLGLKQADVRKMSSKRRGEEGREEGKERCVVVP